MSDATESVPAVAPTGPPPPPWVGLATSAGLALAVLAALQVIGILIIGLSVEYPQLGQMYRIGYAFDTLDKAPLGLELLLATALVVAPAAARERTTAGHDRQALIAIALVLLFAVLIAMGAMLGVFARLEIQDLANRPTTSFVRSVLATYVVRNLGVAALAFGAGLAAYRIRLASAAAP